MIAAGLAPWLALAGLGAFHGLNPAMGWLFAVALGLHRHSRRSVLAALLPIALGHAAAIALVLYAAIAFGLFFDTTALTRVTGLALVGWAAWHLLYGHGRRVRTGMQTGMAGLGVWSMVMATAHGAGLMLLPAAIPLCLSGPTSQFIGYGSLGIGFLAISVHAGSMLVVIAAISLTVYEWLGLGFLRRTWINFDLLWSSALLASGVIILLL